MMSYYVYKFLNIDDDVVYIGKTENLNSRMKSHNHLPTNVYKEIVKIEYLDFKTKDDTELAEKYYIIKMKPIHCTDYKKKKSNLRIDALDKRKWRPYNPSDVRWYLSVNERLELLRRGIKENEGLIGEILFNADGEGFCDVSAYYAAPICEKKIIYYDECSYKEVIEEINNENIKLKRLINKMAAATD